MRSLYLSIRKLAAIVCSWILKVVFLPFPIKRNRIVFESMSGDQYSSNPRALYEYLLLNYGDKLEYVWQFRNPQKYEYLKENKNTIVCKKRSLRLAFLCSTSAALITDVGFNSFCPKRKNQLYLNTWHGGGCYKKVGIEQASNNALDKWRLRTSFVSNYVSSSEYFTQEVVRKQLFFDGYVLETGMPRNDIFFDNKKMADVSLKIRNQYEINHDDYVIIYAPTYRDHDSVREQFAYTQINLQKVADTINGVTGKNAVVLLRGHHFASFSSHPSLSCLDVTDYPDMQDLLCAADMLITDYSSSMWDFSFTGKPCFLFVPDLADYLTYRGLDTDIRTWGFPVCETNDELIAAIENFDPEAYAAAMQRHHDTLGSFEHGTATKEVAEFIMEHVRKK